MKTLQFAPATQFQTKIDGFAAGLSAHARDAVVSLTKDFVAERQAAGNSYLEMGKTLKKLRELLEPLQKWKEYLRLLPNMTQATAYRMIWAFENAERTLPAATLQAAVAGGYKLISNEKNKGIAAGYAQAFARVRKRMGDPPEKDPVAATKFLDAVVAEKRTKGPKRVWKEVELKKMVLRALQRALSHLPPERHAGFVQSVFAAVESRAA